MLECMGGVFHKTVSVRVEDTVFESLGSERKESQGVNYSSAVTSNRYLF